MMSDSTRPYRYYGQDEDGQHWGEYLDEDGVPTEKYFRMDDPTQTPCPTCDGEGWVQDPEHGEWNVCPECQGEEATPTLEECQDVMRRLILRLYSFGIPDEQDEAAITDAYRLFARISEATQ